MAFRVLLCKKKGFFKEMCGIEREIDKLGRVVIPMEYRKKLGIESSSRVLISLENGVVIIGAIKRRCTVCGEEIGVSQKFGICDGCILKIKSDG